MAIIDVYAWHGAGCAQTEGGKANKLIAMSLRWDVDIYAMGHVHELYNKNKPILVATNAKTPKILARERCFVLTGSMLKAYLPNEIDSNASTYVERAGFPPVALGWAEVRIWPEQGLHGQPVMIPKGVIA